MGTMLHERLRETHYDRLTEPERAELTALCEHEQARAEEWRREQDSREPSDAYLTQWAANSTVSLYDTVLRLLRERPECGRRETYCPCGGDLRARTGPWGTFYRCTACGVKYNSGTKRYHALPVRICHSHDLRPVMAEQTGFYYAACRVCHPAPGAGRRPVRDLIGARHWIP